MTTEQTSIFVFIDPDEYELNEFDDMVNGYRTMMHFPSNKIDTEQSSILGWA